MSKLDQKIDSINGLIKALTSERNRHIVFLAEASSLKQFQTTKGGEGSGRYPAGSGGNAEQIKDDASLKQMRSTGDDVAKIRDIIGDTDNIDASKDVSSVVRGSVDKVRRQLEVMMNPRYRRGDITPEVEKGIRKLYDDITEIGKQAEKETNPKFISPQLGASLEKFFLDSNSLYDKMNRLARNYNSSPYRG